MRRHALLRTVFALFLLTGQLAGLNPASGSARETDGQSFSCCCIGECHCTGDCCNHPPGHPADDSRPSLDDAGPWPTIAAPTSCGFGLGTVTFRSDPGTTHPPEATRPMPPAHRPGRRTLNRGALLPRSTALLRGRLPRPPPDDLHA